MSKHKWGKNPNSRNGFKKGHKSFLTNETKKKMSDIAKKTKRRPPSNKGKKFSEETKRKMSKSKAGDKKRKEKNTYQIIQCKRYTNKIIMAKCILLVD